MLQPYSEKLNWRICFDTLLRPASNASGVQFVLHEETSTLKLTVDNADSKFIQERIVQALSSQEGFDKILSYTIQNRAVASKVQPKVIARPEDTPAAGMKILLKLLGNEAFEDSGIDINFIFDGTAISRNRVLYSKITQHKRVVAMWEAAVQHWVSYFQDVEASRIQDAWLTDKPLDAPKADLGQTTQDGKGIVKGLIQQCFGIITDTTTVKAQIFFNFGLLWQYLSVPEIKVQQLPGNQCELTIDKEHLLACLQVYTQGRTLLRVYQSSMTAELQAKALLFGLKPTQAKPMHHTIIVDKSGSTSAFYGVFKSQLIKVIAKLRTLDPNAKLRLVFFSDDSRALEFSISDNVAIENCIHQTQSAGGTRLFGTVTDELEYVRKNKVNENYNGTIIVCTDGYNSVDIANNCKVEEVAREISALNYSSSSLPKMFTVGYGECDSATLQKLAALMGNHYIHLKDVSDFESIFKHLETHSSERQIIDFLVKINNSTRKYRIPFYHSSAIQSPDVILPLERNRPLSVTFLGNDLHITLKEDQIPQATPNDTLNELLVEAKSIVTHTVHGAQTKIALLRAVLTKIDQLAIGFNDRQLISQVRDEITGYQEHLSANALDQRAQTSLVSMLNSQQGFLVTDSSSAAVPSNYREPTRSYNNP